MLKLEDEIYHVNRARSFTVWPTLGGRKVNAMQGWKNRDFLEKVFRFFTFNV